MTYILLIEDDKAVSDITRFFLESQKSYQVTCARNGAEAMSYARGMFDLILMDIMLPDTNGIDLCKSLRKWHHCPIIFCSALDDSDTMIKALEMGGDDFIAKPFDNKLLLAKIQANLRRVQLDAENQRQTGAPGKLLAGSGVVLDGELRQVTVDGKVIRLSEMEYRILAYLIQHAGTFLSGEEIYKNLWGKDPMGDTRTVQVHIHNLRKKLEPDPANPVYLESVWGKGYRFVNGV